MQYIYIDIIYMLYIHIYTYIHIHNYIYNIYTDIQTSNVCV